MTILVRSGTSLATNSFETGLSLGRQIRAEFAGDRGKCRFDRVSPLGRGVMSRHVLDLQRLDMRGQRTDRIVRNRRRLCQGQLLREKLETVHATACRRCNLQRRFGVRGGRVLPIEMPRLEPG